MTDEIKAQRLAAWLSSPAGTPPPEDLDPEVLGAVWALAPDRAPAPRVSIDDIFASVTQGPFAAGGGDNNLEEGEWGDDDVTRVAPVVRIAPVVGTKVKLVAHSGGKLDAPGAVGPAAPSTPPMNVVPMKRSGPSRAWMLPTIGLALAAAAATLIVVPTIGQLSPADPSAQEEARDLGRLSARKQRGADQEADLEGGDAVAPDTVVAPDPAVAPAAQAPADAPAIAEVTAEQEPPVPTTTAAPKPTEDVRRADQPLRDEQTQTKDQRAPIEAAPLGRAGAGVGTQSDQARVPPTPAPPPPPAPLAEVSSSASEVSSRSREEGKAKTFIPETAGPVSPRESSDDSLLDGVVTEQEEYALAARGELAAVEKTEAAKAAASSKKGARAKNDAASSKKAASANKEVAASDRSTQVLSKAPAKYSSYDETPGSVAPQSAQVPASSASTAPSARAVAWPNDYDPNWYSVMPDVAPTFEAARTDELAGRFEDALLQYRTLTTDPRADVAQDASLRAAKVLRALGGDAEALATVDAGLKRSSANTPVRSSLYALRGELLVLLGRGGEAESAWVEAGNLNTGR